MASNHYSPADIDKLLAIADRQGRLAELELLLAVVGSDETTAEKILVWVGERLAKLKHKETTHE